MKVEFNGHFYKLGNKIGPYLCTGCAIYEGINLSCPIDSKRECILPLDKIYIDANFSQIFKL